MYPPIHEKTGFSFSFARLEQLWQRYPQYHEKTVFSSLEALLEEHERYREDFEEVREEYTENGYEKFLVRLSLDDLPYRYETMKLLQASDPIPMNSYVEAFLRQFEELDTDKDACFLFPESFSSQFFVIAEHCRKARIFRPIQNLFPDEEKLHYLAVFDTGQC